MEKIYAYLCVAVALLFGKIADIFIDKYKNGDQHRVAIIAIIIVSIILCAVLLVYGIVSLSDIRRAEW